MLKCYLCGKTVDKDPCTLKFESYGELLKERIICQDCYDFLCEISEKPIKMKELSELFEQGLYSKIEEAILFGASQ